MLYGSYLSTDNILIFGLNLVFIALKTDRKYIHRIQKKVKGCFTVIHYQVRKKKRKNPFFSQTCTNL